MKKLKDKSKINGLIFICAVVYFFSYFTRLNYAAVVPSIIAASGLPRETVILPVTALSITYGIGQLISGYLGDRVQPRHIITFGLFVTGIMNLTMPYVAPNIASMTVVWACNGFAQAMMWPPLVKIFASALDTETYNRATVLVSYGSSAGTIAIYLSAPVLITLDSGWQGIFTIAGCAALCMIFVWNIVMNLFEKQGLERPEMIVTKKNAPQTAIAGGGTRGVIAALGGTLFLIMFAIIMQGMIRDGVTAWMPTFIGDTYGLGESVSILTGVVLPIFSLISFEVTSFLHKKWLQNELLCAGVIAGAAVVFAGLLMLTKQHSALFAILFSALIVACMHGVNLILICMLPAAFNRFGNVSTISGLLNFCTYIGAALSTYGMATIADHFGWNAVILSWVIIAGAAAIACLISVKKWKYFMQ